MPGGGGGGGGGEMWGDGGGAAYQQTFPHRHPADSFQPRERHKSYVLHKKKYYPCQGKVGCPKMNDNILIKNNSRLNDK